MTLTDEELTEIRALAASETMRADSDRLRETRYTPFMVNEEVDRDRVIEFLTEYNEFLNHPLKPQRPFIEKDMRL
jgi:hypothetical protein